MMIDPKQFGLDGRTVIEKDDEGCFSIVINRKSPVIMADGRKIMDKVDKIKSVRPGAAVNLRTRAPLCSKTRVYLEKQGVRILEF
ncbi:MAG: hypothetical protein OEV42_11465 [Deltaproteobacteria bacterium]|nr:hypothetical protein [Deltaproteobacteria bacterium]